MAARRVLILGGYGNFGKRIAENLSGLEGVELIIAGRSAQKAETLCGELSLTGPRARLRPAVVDIADPDFAAQLKAFSADLVIHTGGPFQGQDYTVPAACIAAGSHYIDLADDRRFVCDIATLNEQAVASDVLLVSGASSVPGLSSVIVDHFIDQFWRLDEIDFAIAPGNQAERGEATVRGILSYTGHPFSVFEKGRWVDRFGWMSPRRWCFGKVIGKRWLADIDIPDLELFPERYAGVNSVRFQAGLELPVLHLGMVLMVFLAKIGLVKDWSRYTGLICRSSEIFRRLGTDVGGMQIRLSGLDESRKPRHIKWTLCAENGVGPYIPTLSAIILAKKLLSGALEMRGASPCLGLYTLEEFDAEVVSLGIDHKTEIDNG